MLQLLKAPFLVAHFSNYTLINDLPDDVIYDIAIYADDTNSILSVIRHLISDLWQQLELDSEFESDLGNTADWGRTWLADFNAGKTQLVSFDQSNNTSAIYVKMDGLFLRKNHVLRY